MEDGDAGWPRPVHGRKRWFGAHHGDAPPRTRRAFSRATGTRTNPGGRARARSDPPWGSGALRWGSRGKTLCKPTPSAGVHLVFEIPAVDQIVGRGRLGINDGTPVQRLPYRVKPCGGLMQVARTIHEPRHARVGLAPSCRAWWCSRPRCGTCRPRGVHRCDVPALTAKTAEPSRQWVPQPRAPGRVSHPWAVGVADLSRTVVVVGQGARGGAKAGLASKPYSGGIWAGPGRRLIYPPGGRAWRRMSGPPSTRTAWGEPLPASFLPSRGDAQGASPSPCAGHFGSLLLTCAAYVGETSSVMRAWAREGPGWVLPSVIRKVGAISRRRQDPTHRGQGSVRQ